VKRYSDGVVMPGAITVAADGLSASWTGTLAPSTHYYVYLPYGGVQDLAGQGLNNTYYIHFTTGTN
jgi:hypothetical protein